MDRFPSDACPPFVFGEEAAVQQPDIEMSPPGAYFAQQHQILQEQPTYGNLASYAMPFGYSMNHPTVAVQDQSHRSHQRHHSVSTQSTHSSAHRSSDGSVFSSWHPASDCTRSSVASASTTWSRFSDFSQDPYGAQTAGMFESRSPVASPPPSNAPIQKLSAPVEQAHERQSSQEKDSFLTCVSRTKRSRRSMKEPSYWCTSCGEGFRSKYDWKRHEETYQERAEMFECELCLNVYFLDKDFIHHHQRSHRCQVCAEKKHVALARKRRMARTGWGCGMCNHFSTDWSERCSHISEHFEKKGHTMADWKHSQVIWSLLQRPEILFEWCRLLERKRRTQSPFSWKVSTTGRAEGYPEANPQPQLQDMLEYYTPSQNAAAIAKLAFEKGLREKELPSLPEQRPPVPEKDIYLSQTTRQPTYQDQHSAGYYTTMLGPMADMATWDNFLASIPEDEHQPTNVVLLDYDSLNAAFKK